MILIDREMKFIEGCHSKGASVTWWRSRSGLLGYVKTLSEKECCAHRSIGLPSLKSMKIMTKIPRIILTTC